MRALEINVKNINKLNFIYELNTYCIIQAEPVINGALQDDMKALWESDYLFRPINSNPIFNKIIETGRWDESFVGLDIDSVDTLHAILIQSIEYPCVFFDNNPKNIGFWASKLIETITRYGLNKNPIQYMFELNKSCINNCNKIQIWWKKDIVDFDDGLSEYKLVVTGILTTLEYIYNQFINSSPEDIGKYNLFSYDNDSIKWIDFF